MVWTPVGRGPAALARPRACRPDGGIPVADWVVFPPPARWSRLMRCGAGGGGWPVGLSRPLTNAGTLLRYALGESACSVARPRPELVGCAVPVSVLDPAERGVCPDVVLGVGAPPSLRGAIPEVVLALPATSRALFPGFTLQPLGDGRSLQAFFPMEEAPPGDPPGEGDGPEPQAGDLDLGLELDADEDDEYLLS